MSTNYYLEHRTLLRKRLISRLHIGKSSAGWCFSLQVEPPDINGLNDWRKLFAECGIFSGKQIVDEYGRKVSVQGMLDEILNRRGNNGQIKDPVNGGFYKKYNGVIRHPIDGVHCVGHGGGTYDLICGEFS